MAATKNAYQRYLIIDRTIRSKRFAASRKRILEALAEEQLAITNDMLSKDIDFMRTHKQAPILFDRKRNGYIYTDPDYSFEQSAITEEDKWVLDFANASMQAYGNSNLVIHFDGLVNKLVTGSTKERSNQADGASFITLESTNNYGYEYLHLLYRCIIEQTAVEIKYHPFGKTKRTYKLSPYLLKQYRNRWYVIGFANEKESTLVFALDRIVTLQTIKHKYHIDTKFDKEQYFRYSFGTTHRYDLQPVRVQLQFNKTNKDYILSQPLHHSQQVIEQTEDYAIVELEVLLTWELKAMIFSYSSAVKVLAPQQLKEEIAAELQKAASVYL